MLKEGVSYSIDGDKRDDIIKSLRKQNRKLIKLQWQKEKEERLRKEYPALDDLYNQYQTMLTLLEEQEQPAAENGCAEGPA